MINKKNYNKNYNMRHTYSEIQLDALPRVRILSCQNFSSMNSHWEHKICVGDIRVKNNESKN